MAILGGSPLGLINIRSNTSPTGRSTFNDGNTRNVNVVAYNNGQYNSSFRGNSLFTGDRIVRSWPSSESFSDSMPGANDVDYKGLKDGTSTGTPQGNYKQRRLHTNDVYDTSILNIVEHLSGTPGELKMADFAYLRNLGVYPNNRLMIARRYAGPIGDNIIRPKSRTAKGNYSEYGSLATMISWVPEDDDYLNISFGEKWTDAEADFKELLNKIGGDIQSKGSSTSGGIGGAVGNAIPLPGFTEIFQRKFLENMGILDEGSGDTIPSGNPNLIKEAKRRTTIGYESAGSGLTCTVDIDMTCEYELKFISGIDPTIVWMDILGMILRFGTSPSDTYGLGKNIGLDADKWLKNPYGMVSKVVAKLGDSLKGIKNEVNDAIDSFVSSVGDVAKMDEEEKDAALQAEKDAAKKAGDDFSKYFESFISDSLLGLARKYRVEIMGIVSALSGLPSTPWHITVGNPLRPVFCAGDMLTQNVKLTLGPKLAFNDLPSSIKATFTLTNARPWGMQEIMSKFNSGYLRTIDVQKTFLETNSNESPGMFEFESIKKEDTSATQSTADGTVNTNTAGNQTGGSSNSTNVANNTTKAVNGKLPKN